VRQCKRNNSADTKLSAGGGKRCSRRWSRGFPPAVYDDDHDETGCPPAARGRPHAGADVCLKEAVSPWEAHAGAGSWQDLLRKRSPCCSRSAGRICDSLGAHAGAACS